MKAIFLFFAMLVLIIKQWFGSYEQWEDEFKKTANALGGSSGWVIFAQMLTRVNSRIIGHGTTCTSSVLGQTHQQTP